MVVVVVPMPQEGGEVCRLRLYCVQIRRRRKVRLKALVGRPAHTPVTYALPHSGEADGSSQSLSTLQSLVHTQGRYRDTGTYTHLCT